MKIVSNCFINIRVAQYVMLNWRSLFVPLRQHRGGKIGFTCGIYFANSTSVQFAFALETYTLSRFSPRKINPVAMLGLQLIRV